MKKKFLNKQNLDLFAISLLIIVIIPLNLSISDQSAYNLELFISLMLTFFLLGFILIFFFYLLNLISIKFKIYSILSSLISLLLLWIFITGIFFPVTGGEGPFLNLTLSINKKYEIILKFILTVIFFLFLKKKDKKYFFLRFIYFFIIANFVFIFFNIQNNEKKYHNNNLNEFGKKNLIVLSFDGISGHKIHQEIIDNDILSQNLKDFKFYKDTVTGAPFTSPSTIIEINGKYKKTTSNNFYENILNDKDLNIATYGAYSDLVLDKKMATQEGNLQKYNMEFEVNKFFQSHGVGSVGRWATPLSLSFIEPLFHTNIYKKFFQLITLNDKDKLNPFDQVKTLTFVNLYEYDLIFDNVSLNKSLDNVVRMYHFTFPHWPILINENCEEVKSLDLPSFEHEKILLKCVSKKIIKFLKILKDKKIYSNSMIVIKSDHGKPNYIEKFYSEKISDIFKQKKYNKYYQNYPYNQKINNNFFWGFGRYKTFILIKDQNQTSNEVLISERQVLLHDLSATYCNFFLDTGQCDHFKKNDLIKNENTFSMNSYDIFIPKPEYYHSSTTIDHHKKYNFLNDTSFLDFLKSNEISLSN